MVCEEIATFVQYLDLLYITTKITLYYDSFMIISNQNLMMKKVKRQMLLRLFIRSTYSFLDILYKTASQWSATQRCFIPVEIRQANYFVDRQIIVIKSWEIGNRRVNYRKKWKNKCIWTKKANTKAGKNSAEIERFPTPAFTGAN